MEIVKLQMEIFYVMIRKNGGKNKGERWIKQMLKLKTKLVIYRNVLGNKNIYD